ncbi:unnamed protein product, partial [Timema podura]|nr:unnamed protein product [Timema podura]
MRKRIKKVPVKRKPYEHRTRHHSEDEFFIDSSCIANTHTHTRARSRRGLEESSVSRQVSQGAFVCHEGSTGGPQESVILDVCARGRTELVEKFRLLEQLTRLVIPTRTQTRDPGLSGCPLVRGTATVVKQSKLLKLMVTLIKALGYIHKNN